MLIGLAKLSYLQDPMSDKNCFLSATLVVIRVSTKHKPINTQYTIHGHMLQEVDSSKYLGVTISKDLRWD
jgi:hypothetical protein